MSVQAGIWDFDGKPVDRKRVADLSDSLKQQGPDGEFWHTGGSLALLYRPFHTTAESRREKQPYVSRRGFVITWDGRLDNRNDLAVELGTCVDAEATDVALFAAAFDLWETDCFPRLIGDWATCIWKPQRRELVFACDYMNIRHIFYRHSEDCIWWCTSLAPLVLLTSNKLIVDDDYMGGYFANDPDSDRTPYRQIRQVAAGHFVQIRAERAATHRFWFFSPSSRIRYKTDGEYEEHFRSVFRAAVNRRLRSDCPILAELSGGLDSSSIVCVADDILKRGADPQKPLDTLSCLDVSEPHGDDSLFLQKIEEKRGRSGIHLNASNAVGTALVLTSGFSEIPGSLGIGELLGHQRAAAVRTGGYRVVISGIGGDEFLGGVPNPTALMADLLVQFKCVTLAKQLMSWSLVKRRPWIQLLCQALAEILPTSLAKHLLRQAKVAPWLKKAFARRTNISFRQLDVHDHFGLWMPTRRSYLGGVLAVANQMAKIPLPQLSPEERRYPYLDRNLVEFVLSIPASQLLRPGERRSLMRRALVGIVPQEILSRRTKQLWARIPVVTLRNHIRELEICFEKPLSEQLGYVDRSRFLDELRAVINGKDVHLVRVLKTIALEMWLRDLASRGLLDLATDSPPEVASTTYEAVSESVKQSSEYLASR